MTHLPEHEIFTCVHDPRFSFALGRPAGEEALKGLLVGVHDSERNFESFMRGFADFAGAQRLAVMAPIFQPDAVSEGYADGYKVLHEQGLRYDELLHAMLDQVVAHLGCPDPLVLMHGYSGGAQFVHLYLMLHPQRLAAASIAAPGEVTLPDADLHWWGGVGNTPTLFGAAVDWARVAQVAVHLAVGDQDASTEQLTEQPPSRYWPDDEARLRADRRARLATLHQAMAQVGVQNRFELMPGVEHSNGHEPAMARAVAFFEQALRARRSGR